MKAAIALLALTGCTQSIEAVRQDRATPNAVIYGNSFDSLVGCIGSATSRRDLRYTPTEQGGSFIYSTHGLGGSSSMLVDVYRSSPPRAEVRVTGGPWLGQDGALIREVKSCSA